MSCYRWQHKLYLPLSYQEEIGSSQAVHPICPTKTGKLKLQNLHMGSKTNNNGNIIAYMRIAEPRILTNNTKHLNWVRQSTQFNKVGSNIKTSKIHNVQFQNLIILLLGVFTVRLTGWSTYNMDRTSDVGPLIFWTRPD